MSASVAFGLDMLRVLCLLGRAPSRSLVPLPSPDHEVAPLLKQAARTCGLAVTAPVPVEEPNLTSVARTLPHCYSKSSSHAGCPSAVRAPPPRPVTASSHL